MGDAEVRQQNVPVPVWLDLHQHVAGLHVGVDYSVLVRVLQSVRHLANDVHHERQARRKTERAWPPALDGIGQRAVRHILHHQEPIPVFESAVVNRQDVGMLEPAEQLGFADHVAITIRGLILRP